MEKTFQKGGRKWIIDDSSDYQKMEYFYKYHE